MHPRTEREQKPRWRIALLGPQRFRPTVVEALDALGVEGTLLAVTAGWREREHEDEELREHVGRPLVNLQLYDRYERVLREDAELAAALAARQEQLREAQRLYRLRLDHALRAARELMARDQRSDFLEAHRRDAIRAVRTLDRQHLARLHRVHESFVEQWQPEKREAVIVQRREMAEALAGASALVVAGGHVAVLLNRMRLFDLPRLLDHQPIVAWSAGAMALSDRVVLFHDSPPQGAGNPEVLDAGLGLCPDLVPLPDARQRLRLEDPVRVALFARRFSPSICVALDGAARLLGDGHRWRAAPGTNRLGRRGKLMELRRS
jgi:hypothetical protein